MTTIQGLSSMLHRLRLKFSIAQIMAVVAVAAVLLAILPASLAIGSFVLLGAFTIAVVAIAARLNAPSITVAAWLACSYPVLPVLSLYITWLTAWVALGHQPRPSLDDPK